MALLQGARGGRGSNDRDRKHVRGVESSQATQGGVVKSRGRGGRGGRTPVRGGRGRGGRRGGRSQKPKTKEQLDAEMDRYFFKDHNKGQTRLNDDLDEYFKQKKQKVDATAEDAEPNKA